MKYSSSFSIIRINETRYPRDWLSLSNQHIYLRKELAISEKLNTGSIIRVQNSNSNYHILDLLVADCVPTPRLSNLHLLTHLSIP